MSATYLLRGFDQTTGTFITWYAKEIDDPPPNEGITDIIVIGIVASDDPGVLLAYVDEQPRRRPTSWERILSV